jgi:hypothetical protein
MRVRYPEHFLHRFEKGLSEPSTTPRATPDASCRHARDKPRRRFDDDRPLSEAEKS